MADQTFDARAMDEALELIQLLPAEDPLTVQLTREFMADCLPWVVTVAETLKHRSREVPIRDLVQEGALAVQQRIRKFRTGSQAWPKYMQMVARNAMNLAIAKCGPVYLSDWSRRKFIKARRLARENGSTLATELEAQGLSEESRKALEHGIGVVGLFPTRGRGSHGSELRAAVRQVGHFDPDLAPPVNEVMEAREQLEQVRDFVARLDLEHAEVISLAFGFDDEDESRTDVEIARVLQLPVARVVEMKQRGLEQIRARVVRSG